MAIDLLQRIHAGETLLCDGGMGTLLAKSAGKIDCPERLVLERPDVVTAAHIAYFSAGSDLVETNTFGGSRARLDLHGLGERAAEISEKAAEIAKSVCPEGRFVLGSIGPTGEMLEPYGDATADSLAAMFREQAQALASGGVDAIIVETMMDAEEARLAVTEAKGTGLPVIATMTFAVGPAGVRTQWGVDPESAVRALEEAGADVIGSNCGNGFEDMLAVMVPMRESATRPLIAQANAGVPEMIDGVPHYHETPEEIRPKASRLLDLGLGILGGCCGTEPDHIRVMRELINDLKTARP
jgi:5-methyltetrahydrofolate--homocysteine methyltransferase